VPPAPVDRSNWTEPPLQLRGPCPLSAAAFRRALTGHPNRQLVTYVVNGLHEGFDTNVDVPEEQVDLVNHLTPDGGPQQVAHMDKWFAAEIDAGRYVEIELGAHPFLRFAPVGTAPKRSYEPGVIKFRTITDESAGGSSVNAGISKPDHTLEYITVQDVVETALDFGTSCRFNKYDIRSAFRNLAKHRSVLHCHGIRWRGRSFVDTCLAFGTRSSPRIFDAVATSVEWVIQQRLDAQLGAGTCVVRHLIDDFVVVCRGSAAARSAHEITTNTFAELGAPTSVEKCAHDLAAGEYLGIQIDTEEQTLALTPEKLVAYRADCVTMAHPRLERASRRDFLRLAGRLSYATIVPPQLAPFINELWRAAYSIKGKNMAFKGEVTGRLRDDLAAVIWILDHVPPAQCSGGAGGCCGAPTATRCPGM